MTSDVASGPGAPGAPAFVATSHEVDDYWAWQDLAWDRGWTDGLPVAPPTPERVRALVDATGLAPDHSLGKVAPGWGEATIEAVAINAAMAGCWPSLMPAVLASLRCVLHPEFNLNGVQGTTNPCAPLAILNGPIRAREGFHVGTGALGGGSRANAALGRAMRLVLWNIGEGKPGVVDMATLGHPGKWCYCVAENEEDSPWETMAQDRGFAREDDVVTVFACDAPHAMFLSGSPERMLKVLAQSLPRWSINMFYTAGQLLLIVGPRVAHALAGYGMSLDDLRRFVFERARFSYEEMVEADVLHEEDETTTYWGAVSAPWNLMRRREDRLPMVMSERDVHIVVAGGTGQWWVALCPGWGSYGGFARSQPIGAPS
jgi:hypothetical protein